MAVNLKPPLAIAPLPLDKQDAFYQKMRLKVFLGIFFGYAGYYLVRKNFALAIPSLLELGFTKSNLGWAMSAIPIAYGISKFLMGNLSDRSDARKFIVLGLTLSAFTMFLMGAWSWATQSIVAMFALLLINGWFQGMGWPASARVMVHWFSSGERGVKMSIWNVAHNVGGGLVAPFSMLGFAVFGSWQSILYFPAIVALLVAAVAWFLVRDRPQAVGLPAIENYRAGSNTETLANAVPTEAVLSAREIFFKHVLNNKMLWLIALANIFVYFVRNGIIDWAPTYLAQAKGFSAGQAGWAYFAYEYAGIPGTLLCGFLSDKVFAGRRADVILIYLILVTAAVFVYWKNPPGFPLIDNLALIAIGFLIYGPVMLIGVQALDLVPKQAAGTAAGLTGLFGYLGGALFANIGMGYLIDYFDWDAAFMAMLLACLLAILFTLCTLTKRIAD